MAKDKKTGRRVPKSHTESLKKVIKMPKNKRRTSHTKK